MTAIPQHTLPTDERSPARTFWETQTQKHPTIAGILHTLSSVVGFFLNGHFIVAIGHWLVITAGRIAETALLLATLWVTAANVAPDLVAHLGNSTVTTISGLALIAFSLLPEIIVFSAIVTSFQQWARFFRDRRAANPAWVWALLYTLPTGAFITMTVITISSFVTSEGAVAHATGAALVARCLSGWFYSLVELLAASIGRRAAPAITQRQVEDQLATLVARTRTTVESAVATTVANMEQRLTTQVATLSGQVATVVANTVATEVANKIANSVATEDQSGTYGGATERANTVANEQLEMLVELLRQQAETISQLSTSLAEVRREVRTTVTEIRSFTQEGPAALSPAPRAMRTLPAARSATREANLDDESEEKPAQRVARFLSECQGRGYKPTLREIQDVCQVAKATAGKVRATFYGGELESQEGES